MSNKNREYEVWEQEHGYKWKLITTFPTIDEAEELIGQLDSEKNFDCHPLEEPDFIYRIVAPEKGKKAYLQNCDDIYTFDE